MCFSSDECFVCVCSLKINFSKQKKNHENPSESNSLDLDLARRFVESGLDVNCLQMSSADDKSRCKRHQKGTDISSGRFICNGSLYFLQNTMLVPLCRHFVALKGLTLHFDVYGPITCFDIKHVDQSNQYRRSKQKQSPIHKIRYTYSNSATFTQFVKLHRLANIMRIWMYICSFCGDDVFHV